MKLIIVVALALVAVSCATDSPKTLRSEYNQDPEGSYRYGYETDNGLKVEESGVLKQTVDEDKKPVTVLTKTGSYSYTNSEGKEETIHYTADEDGFRPEGSSIPVPPSVRR